MARTESGEAEPAPRDDPAEASGPVDSTPSALADAIRDAKQQAGLSQSEIGRRIGVDQTVVSTWARGAAIPSVERILALDRLFGLRPGTLLERAGLVEPRTTEEAIASEPAIDDDDKHMLQGMVAARRRTAASPTPLDDLFLLNRERLQEAVDGAVARALAVRAVTPRPANAAPVEDGIAPPRQPSRPAFAPRHRRHINGR
jgi:transcriptional regulator with XRE-family HTH domain